MALSTMRQRFGSQLGCSVTFAVCRCATVAPNHRRHPILSFEPITCATTLNPRCGETCPDRNVNFQRKTRYETASFRHFRMHALKAAGVGAALMLSASAGHAQSGPFAGFDGSWSGTGTVALSDGTNERIRCRASYKVNGGGAGPAADAALRQRQLQIRSEQRRRSARATASPATGARPAATSTAICRARAGGGQIEVFVEAAGFAANLTLTHPRQQAVGADQFQGRDPGRQHHHGARLTRRTSGIHRRTLSTSLASRSRGDVLSLSGQSTPPA